MNRKKMKKRREELELTQREVADYVGCSLRTISFWETRKGDISSYYLKKLSEILNISMEELMDEECDDRNDE